MNKEDINKYKGYYYVVAFAMIGVFALSVIGIFFELSFLGPVQIVVLINVFTYTNKVSKIPKFPNQKIITKFVVLWGCVIGFANGYLIYKLSNDIYYLSSEEIDLVSTSCTIVLIILIVVVNVKCFQNIKILNTLEVEDDKDIKSHQSVVEL